MVCVMIVAVRLVLRNKFGPPRVLRIAGSAAVPRGRESSRGAGIGLPFPVGAELELVVRAGGQPGQGGRLGPRSRRHFLLRIAGSRRGLIAEIDLVTGALERKSARQRGGGFGHGARRRGSEGRFVRIGFGKFVLAGFERGRRALHTPRREVGEGVNDVEGLGQKTVQRGRKGVAVDPAIRRVGERTDLAVDDGRIGKSHAHTVQHALAEAGLAGHFDRRAADRGLGRQKPPAVVLRLFIPAGGEGHGEAQKQECAQFFHHTNLKSLSIRYPGNGWHPSPPGINYLKFQNEGLSFSFGASGTLVKNSICVFASISATEVMYCEGLPLG